MWRAAHRLLVPGLLGLALAAPASAAPAKAPPEGKGAARSGAAQKKSGGKKTGGKNGKKTGKENQGKKKPGEEKAGGKQTGQAGSTTGNQNQAGAAAGKKAPASGEKSQAGKSDNEEPAESRKAAAPAGGGVPTEEKAEAKKTPPPPPPPRADEQQPHPYLKLPPPEKPSRKVDLGVDVGMQYLPAKGSEASYGPGLSLGAHARIEIAPWMGFRLSVERSSQSVSVPDGGLGLPAGTRIDQPDVSVLMLRAQLEPTWVVSPRFRLWAGVGAGWGRISAPAVTTSGTEADLHSTGRKGVTLEFSGELGASVDVIPDWLAASLMLSGGALTNQSGEVFSASQAFTTDGRRIELGGLPHFGSSLSALLGVGVLL